MKIKVTVQFEYGITNPEYYGMTADNIDVNQIMNIDKEQFEDLENLVRMLEEGYTVGMEQVD